MVFTWYWSIFKIASFRVSALDGFKTTAWCLRESIFSRSRGKKESYTKIILNDTKYTYAYIYLVFIDTRSHIRKTTHLPPKL